MEEGEGVDEKRSITSHHFISESKSTDHEKKIDVAQQEREFFPTGMVKHSRLCNIDLISETKVHL